MEGKKQDIIDAAIKMFGKDGYDKTSINDIVKEAGVSKGLVYHHFENKESLFKEAYIYCADKIVRNITSSDLYKEKDIFKLFINIGIVKADYMKKNPHIVAFIAESYKSLDRAEFSNLKSYIDGENKKIMEYSFANIDMSEFRDDIPKNECIEFIRMTFQGYVDKMIEDYEENFNSFLSDPQKLLDAFSNIVDMIRYGVYK